MKKVSKSDLINVAKEIYRRNYGGWISILYEYEKDGQITYRWVRGRMGVKKHEKTGVAPYDFEAKGCLNIFDNETETEKPRYRSLKFAKILAIKVRHEVFVLEGVNLDNYPTAKE